MHYPRNNNSFILYFVLNYKPLNLSFIINIINITIINSDFPEERGLDRNYVIKNKYTDILSLLGAFIKYQTKAQYLIDYFPNNLIVIMTSSINELQGWLGYSLELETSIKEFIDNLQSNLLVLNVLNVLYKN